MEMKEGWAIWGIDIWLIRKFWKVIFCSDYNASTLFRNLQKRSLKCKERCTLQIRYPLWSTVRLSLT